MTNQDRSEFVPVAEAARRLGLSVSTVKRRILAGTLEAEQIQRRQGTAYRVKVPRDVPDTSRERSDLETVPPSTETYRDVPAEISAATAPLLERLAVADQTIAEKDATIRTLERENGELSAKLSTVQTQLVERSTVGPAQSHAVSILDGYGRMLVVVAILAILAAVALVWRVWVAS